MTDVDTSPTVTTDAEESHTDPVDTENSHTDSVNAAEASADDPDADYRAEADWGLDDLTASDELVERYVTLGGEERRLRVREATNADADAIKRKLKDKRRDEYEALAEFFRSHIDEPASFATCTAADVEAMRMGVAETLVGAIAPDLSGNLL